MNSVTQPLLSKQALIQARGIDSPSHQVVSQAVLTFLSPSTKAILCISGSTQMKAATFSLAPTSSLRVHRLEKSEAQHVCYPGKKSPGGSHYEL